MEKSKPWRDVQGGGESGGRVSICLAMGFIRGLPWLSIGFLALERSTKLYWRLAWWSNCSAAGGCSLIDYDGRVTKLLTKSVTNSATKSVTKSGTTT